MYFVRNLGVPKIFGPVSDSINFKVAILKMHMEILSVFQMAESVTDFRQLVISVYLGVCTDSH